MNPVAGCIRGQTAVCVNECLGNGNVMTAAPRRKIDKLRIVKLDVFIRDPRCACAADFCRNRRNQHDENFASGLTLPYVIEKFGILFDESVEIRPAELVFAEHQNDGFIAARIQFINNRHTARGRCLGIYGKNVQPDAGEEFAVGNDTVFIQPFERGIAHKCTVVENGLVNGCICVQRRIRVGRCGCCRG